MVRRGATFSEGRAMIVKELLGQKGDRLITVPFVTEIKQISKMMSEEKVGVLLLTDTNGRLGGLISERDIINACATHGPSAFKMKGEQLMTRELTTCTGETELEDALELMGANGIRHLPVLEGEKLVGLVSVRDALNVQTEMLDEQVNKRTEELRVARDEASRANKYKSEFIAKLSHELRTPLNGIIGFSQLIENQAWGPIGNQQYLDCGNDINQCGQHLLSLINDILDLSKIESGKDDLQEQSVDISQLTDTVMILARQKAAEAKVTLGLDFAQGLPTLRADELKLKQVLINILTNAIKFTNSGGEVKLRAWSSKNDGYVLQVIDTGIGIAPEDIPKALSQFGQVDSDRNRHSEGTGIGLPISKALVELHGGSLDLQSELGIGTTVTVRLPAARIEISTTKSDAYDERYLQAS